MSQFAESTFITLRDLDSLMIRDSQGEVLFRNGYTFDEESQPTTWSPAFGLPAIAYYYASGHSHALAIAQASARSCAVHTNEYGIIETLLADCTVDSSLAIYTGTNGWAGQLIHLSALCAVDSTFKPLCRKVAYGLMHHGIDHTKQLAYYKVNQSNAQACNDSQYGRETQIGTSTCTVANALLLASEQLGGDPLLVQEAITLLQSVWTYRDPDTQLIPEVVDLATGQAGKTLYPASQFRMDDMAGMYIRALTHALYVTDDRALKTILPSYTAAVLEHTWDTRIGGGAFRYLTNLQGEGAAELETMYASFICALQNAKPFLPKTLCDEIDRKCIAHNEHVFHEGFGIKNGMIPHAVNKNGDYINTRNDSQLLYAAQQFPLGMVPLYGLTHHLPYILMTQEVMNSILNKHLIHQSNGRNSFVNVVETQAPFEPDRSYAKPTLSVESCFLSSYALFLSLKDESGIIIDWFGDTKTRPILPGLVAEMPLWDLDMVRWKSEEKSLFLQSVTSSQQQQSLHLEDFGYKHIVRAYCDGQVYDAFDGNRLQLLEGQHAYWIQWE